MNVLLSVLLIFTLACVFPKGSMISMVARNPLLPGAPQKLVLVNSVELAWFISSRAIQQSQSPSKAFSMMPFMAKMQSVVLCPLECHRNLHVHSRLWLKPHLLGHNKTWLDCLCESHSYKVALAERILRSCMDTHVYHCSLGSIVRSSVLSQHRDTNCCRSRCTVVFVSYRNSPSLRLTCVSWTQRVAML